MLTPWEILPLLGLTIHAGERWAERFPESPVSLRVRLAQGGPAVIDLEADRFYFPVVAPRMFREALTAREWAGGRIRSGRVVTTVTPVDPKIVRSCRRVLADAGLAKLTLSQG